LALQTPKPNAGPAPTAPAPVSLAARAAALGFRDSHCEEADLQLGIGLWGTYMCGKTTHAMSFPNPLVYNFDPNSASITKQNKRCPFVQVRTYKQMVALAQAAANHELTELVRALYPDEFGDYTVETLVTDSSTGQGNLVEEHLETLDFTTKTGAYDGNKKYDMKLLLLNQYYRQIQHARERVPGKESYMHVVTIHEKIRTDEKGNTLEINADITGRFGKLIFQQNDANFFCELQLPEVLGDKSGKVMQNAPLKACVRSVPHTKWHAGVGDRVGGLGRYGKLPPYLYPPPNDKGGLWSILEEHWMGTAAK
jgi:hypothetical protein